MTALFLKDIVEIVGRYERSAADTGSRSQDRWAAVERVLQAALDGVEEADGCLEEEGPGDGEPQHRSCETRKEETDVRAGRARRHMADALIGKSRLSPEALEALAIAIGWAGLPQRVQPVVMAANGTLPRLPTADSIMTLLASGELCILIPDPGRETSAGLRTLLSGRAAAVGPAVGRADAGAALRWTRRLLALQHPNGSGPGVSYVEEHLSMVILLQDEALAALLVEHRLGVMEKLTQRQREQLSETLMVWLVGGGSTVAARVLGVHPQTIRYRVRKLERLFGAALHDPRSRFELELALRLRQLLPGPRRRRPRAVESLCSSAEVDLPESD
ncbi:helix-turn-helix domain-containing protein [Kitasatospora sp. NPDC089509]|uniref:PucR family transcriptional regulator n=1 Tax=Kitasatospora sp. NPDC089509 TaxID=3364079 RepID=UPI0037FF3F53